MSNGTFDFNVFLNESKETLLNPKSYFTSMKTGGGMVEPLIKAVIYGGVAGLIYMIWGFLKIGASGFGMLGGAVGIMALISMLIGAVIGLFIGAVIMLVISAICKGNTDYEANLRVTASVMVIMPVSALLGFAMGINLTLGIIVSILVSLYALWIMYHGLTAALKGGESTARIVLIVLAVIMVLFSITSIAASRKASKFLREYNKDAREILKDLQ
ncbi:MAG TPA: Yip1 family protein [Bacteroidales bacterium]|nr:Yip1 family protein [Bacteroidales bacterium]